MASLPGKWLAFILRSFPVLYAAFPINNANLKRSVFFIYVSSQLNISHSIFVFGICSDLLCNGYESEDLV